MKKRFISTYCTLLLVISLNAQNIVPNPGFEDHEYLPTVMCKTGLEFERAVKWWTVPNEASTDLISPRLNSRNLKACEARSGKNMAGIVINGDFWSEYVGVKLREPLRPGHQYYVEYWLSMPRFYSKRNPVPTYLNDHFGVRFDRRLYKHDKRIWERQPQVPASDQVFVEPEKWTKITATFTAQEAHTHMYIGQFWDSKTQPELAIGYYFVDDVYVEAFKSSAVDYVPSRYYQIQGDVASVIMENIYFETDRYELLEESYQELDKLVNILQKNPNLEINIHGHTDAQGSEMHNDQLSDNRAKAVREYLMSNGIAESRLQSKGFGYSKPVADNTTEKGRQENRRVEFIISGGMDENGKQVLSPATVYRFSDQFPPNHYAGLSRIGYFDKNWTCPSRKGPTPPVNDSKRIEQIYTSKKAADFILNKTQDAQVVFINEHPLNPQHRAFVSTLLEQLSEQGFKYLAMESLSASDEELTSRGYPVLASGTYSREPLYADMVRQALQLGFQLFPYASSEKQLDKAVNILKKQSQIPIAKLDDPAFCQALASEWSQALNLTRILKKEPDAKIVVFASDGHIREDQEDSMIYMGKWFQRFSSIDPLSIDQRNMSEACPEMENGLYKKFVSQQAMVLNRADYAFPLNPDKSATAYDIHVFHPRSTLKNGRPDWLRMEGYRQFYPFNPDKHNMDYPCMVLAYREGEDVDVAIPMDVVEYAHAGESKRLMLPSGKYTLILRDKVHHKQLEIQIAE
ncbi:MAG: OmpA family protein [Bacteroidota bacterium]